MTRKYLLMPIAAAMQSWGDFTTAGDDKPSLSFPTHSGICGLIGAALGIRREESSRLAVLHRQIDFLTLEISPGERETDFYSVTGVLRAGPLKAEENSTFIGRKTYLADARFLLALTLKEPRCEFSLEQIGQALLNPYFPIYAGRKAYPFSQAPVFHKKGEAVLLEWENPFAELLQLKEELAKGEKTPTDSIASDLFPGFPITLAPISRFIFGESWAEAFQGITISQGQQLRMENLSPLIILDQFQADGAKIRTFKKRAVYLLTTGGSHVS